MYHLHHNVHSFAPIYAHSASSMPWFTMHYPKILQAFNILEDDMLCDIVKIGNIIFDWWVPCVAKQVVCGNWFLWVLFVSLYYFRADAICISSCECALLVMLAKVVMLITFSIWGCDKGLVFGSLQQSVWMLSVVFDYPLTNFSTMAGLWAPYCSLSINEILAQLFGLGNDECHF